MVTQVQEHSDTVSRTGAETDLTFWANCPVPRNLPPFLVDPLGNCEIKIIAGLHVQMKTLSEGGHLFKVTQEHNGN